MLTSINAPTTGAGPVRKSPQNGKLAVIGAVLAAIALCIAFSQFTFNSAHGPANAKADAITQTINTVVPSANADGVDTPALDQSPLKDDKEYERYTINGHIQAF